MNAPISSKTFKSGNSVAVRLPARFGFGPNVPIELAQDGRRITITAKTDPAEEQRRLIEMIEALNALPKSGKPWPRSSIDFKDWGTASVTD
jgi:antitoxin VapB